MVSVSPCRHRRDRCGPVGGGRQAAAGHKQTLHYDTTSLQNRAPSAFTHPRYHTGGRKAIAEGGAGHKKDRKNTGKLYCPRGRRASKTAGLCDRITKGNRRASGAGFVIPAKAGHPLVQDRRLTLYRLAIAGVHVADHVGIRVLGVKAVQTLRIALIGELYAFAFDPGQ